MMINRNYFSIINRLPPTLRIIDRTVSIRSSVNLGAQMKELNDTKQYKQALSLFDAHKQSELSDLAINQALQASIRLRDFQRGLTIHQQLSPRSLKCSHIQTSLVQIYTRCGDVTRAQHVFSTVPEKQRTPFLYTAMINGLVWNHRMEEALSLFEQMTVTPDKMILTIVFDICANLANKRALETGRKIFAQLSDSHYNDTVVVTSALNMFLKNGDVTNAEQLFAKIKSKSIFTYGIMMKGYNLNNNPTKTLILFERMKEKNIELNNFAFTYVIQACSKIAMIEYCRSIAAQIPNHFLSDLIIQNALIDMWGKAGLADKAQLIFETIQNPDTVSFGAMINAFGLNGMGSRAVDLYAQMSPNIRNDVIHICVLNACSHSGLLNEARSIFNAIPLKTIKITTTMVDCLSRMHMFDEAQKLVADFERVHSPHPVMYLAMMSGARNQCNADLSEKLLVKMKTLFPDLKDGFISASILLANTYSSRGESDRSFDLKKQIRESGIKPQVGLSWTCVNGQLVEFRAHDQSHPQTKEIYQQIHRLSKEIIEAGHKFDPRSVTRALGNSETVQSVLSGHSERLAIAFNLIQKSIPSPIQITKNLRVCDDCHAAIKLIAKIHQREIIVRDANRIHHFYPDGQCSCQDLF